MSHVYVLVGQPNSGKTTLYNWLTGSNYKTVNYPGSTIEYSMGAIDLKHGTNKTFVDTPGTYSLIPKSPDERVTSQVLYDNEQTKNAYCILVIDGLHLERQLTLVYQMKQAGIQFGIVVTMVDLLKAQNTQIDFEKLSHLLNVPIDLFNGQTGEGIDKIIAGLPLTNENTLRQKISWTYLDFQRARIEAMEDIEKVMRPTQAHDISKFTKKLDSLFLGSFGFVFFFLIMTFLFASLFWFSTPFSDLIENVFAFLSTKIETSYPDSFLALFVSQGIVASFAAVLVFVPQILFLFLGLGFLEASGYLPRAAALIDHPLQKIGLGGRSFVPVLSGFACAVPALMATRNISSKRDRMITAFIIPMMSCSARLPVYGLLLLFLFPDNAFLVGLVFAGLYFLSLMFGAIASLVISKIVKPSRDQFFMMELPLYRRPRWRILVKQALSKTKSYVVRAGPIIIVFAVVLWLGAQFPRINNQAPDLADSYIGQLGHFMEPVFKPMGIDWRVGVGLISAFAAREVFVSSIAVTFKVTAAEDQQEHDLLQVMNQAKFADGTPVFTVGSVLGLIFFFMIALQCMTTVATQIRESGSQKFAWGQLVILNVVAYVGAVVINQVYTLFF
ncbi:MAG: ferrous iron transporter B [Bdellovibrionaceae bacterium]|nr:ferrous iron transporter B [Pseudobdellovibrionaceae bacterium]